MPHLGKANLSEVSISSEPQFELITRTGSDYFLEWTGYRLIAGKTEAQSAKSDNGRSGTVRSGPDNESSKGLLIGSLDTEGKYCT